MQECAALEKSYDSFLKSLADSVKQGDDVAYMDLIKNFPVRAVTSLKI